MKNKLNQPDVETTITTIGESITINKTIPSKQFKDIFVTGTTVGEFIPTEEEIIKEWEALGYKWVEQRKNTQLEIHLLNNISEIIIYTKSKMYECIDRETDDIVQPLTFQEHQLLTKTFKMLGWYNE